MNTKHLSSRLEAIAQRVLPNAPMADVGADHAHLPISLVLRGHIPSAIAIERVPSPLATANTEIARFGLEGVVETRLGDGLAPLLPHEVSTLTIAGMGGGSIQKILSQKCPITLGIKRLILQPNRDPVPLRRWLQKQGWTLSDGTIAEDRNLFYEIITVDPSKVFIPLSKETLFLGFSPQNAHIDELPTLLRFLNMRLGKAHQRQTGLRASLHTQPSQLSTLQEEIDLLKHAKSILCQRTIQLHF